MFWDPYFGWDTHMIRSCLFGLSALCVLAALLLQPKGLVGLILTLVSLAWFSRTPPRS